MSDQGANLGTVIIPQGYPLYLQMVSKYFNDVHEEWMLHGGPRTVVGWIVSNNTTGHPSPKVNWHEADPLTAESGECKLNQSTHLCFGVTPELAVARAEEWLRVNFGKEVNK